MSDAVQTVTSAGKVPWQGLGNNVSNDLSPHQLLKAAGLDWKVAKRKMFYHPEGHKSEIEVKGKFALVRDKDDRCLSVVGQTYKPVQNDVAMDFFKKFVEAGHMKMETAGSLHGGQYIWSLARIGRDFKLAGKDEVRGYLLLCQPHLLGKAMVIQFTPIRVECWNTLNFPLGSNLKGKAGAFRMPHSLNFNDSVKATAELARGLAANQMEEFKAAATLLSRKKAKPDSVTQFFTHIIGPKKGKVPRMLVKMQKALTESPGATLASAEGTWWGALNAVSYVVDHEVGRDQSAALRTAWMGAKAGLKRRAVSLAMEAAK